jgi:hypothetical protein
MVEVVIDTGGGGARTFEISATRAGRRVEVTNARGIVEVAELTRTGHPVRVGRFMAARVIAIVEAPECARRAGGNATLIDGASTGRQGKSRSVPKANPLRQRHASSQRSSRPSIRR